MAATVIQGKELSREIRAALSVQLERLKASGVVPGLTVVLVGDDPASVSYVTGKEKMCLELGMSSRTVRLPATTTEAALLALLGDLNRDDAVSGILVQLPVPEHIRSDVVIRAIDPDKDVDGVHPVSIGRMLIGVDTFYSCTPYGIVKMLQKTGQALVGADVVILGRSNLVGKPLALLLMQAPYHCTVTVCHTKTRGLKEKTLRADIVVAAVGRPGTLTADMVKPGAVVIDVGVNRVPDAAKASGFALVGDTDYQGLLSVASFVTPVPGGVGPMTITMLMANTVKAACLRHGIPFEL